MRRFLTFSLLAALAACALLLSGCGGDSSGDLPARSASDLNDALTEIQDDVANDDCSHAEDQANSIASNLNDSKNGLSPDLRAALVNGFTHLAELAGDPNTCGANAPVTPTKPTHTGKTGPTGNTGPTTGPTGNTDPVGPTDDGDDQGGGIGIP